MRDPSEMENIKAFINILRHFLKEEENPALVCFTVEVKISDL